MYLYKETVRYSAVDKTGKLTIPTVVDYLQDCCTMQSESLGVGLHHLQEVKKGWVLKYWQIDFLREVDLGEVVEVGTWAYDTKGINGYRNFLIQNEDGEALVKANSVWVLVDAKTARPVRVEPEDVALYGAEPRLEMEYTDRKIKLDGEGKQEEPFPVRKYHIDTNGHVNNCWYIRFAMEYLPESIFEGGKRIGRLRVDYKKSAVYGDKIYPAVYEADGEMKIALNDEAGVAYAIVHFVYA